MLRGREERVVSKSERIYQSSTISDNEHVIYFDIVNNIIGPSISLRVINVDNRSTFHDI